MGDDRYWLAAMRLMGLSVTVAPKDPADADKAAALERFANWQLDALVREVDAETDPAWRAAIDRLTKERGE